MGEGEGGIIGEGTLPRDDRFTPGGTYHIRDWLIFMSLVGDIEGMMTYVQSSNWTLPDGQRCYFCGSLAGPATVDVARFMGSDVSAQLRGQITAHVDDVNAAVRGTVVLHGSGDLDGVKVRLTFTGNLSPFGFTYPYEGTALHPNGG